MAGVGIGLGILVFFLVSIFTGELIAHGDKNAGTLPGLIAAVWVAWPFFHKAGVSRYNFLHPVPREYKVPLKPAYKKIRDILADANYGFGDKWNVSTSDTIQNYIKASLRFVEEEIHRSADARGNIHERKENVRRLLEMEVQFKDTGADSTIIQFDFKPKTEGLKWIACDHIVNGIISAVDRDLGASTERGRSIDTALPAPPWWLLIAGGLGVLSLASIVLKAVFG